jgi:hypothetical protein
MKIIALIALLAAPSAFALECNSTYFLEEGGKVYVMEPALKVRAGENGGWTSVPFATLANYRSTLFGNNLCQLCGWGDRSSAFTVSDVQHGEVAVALLNGDGELQEVSYMMNPYHVRSLTCVR